MKPLVSIITPTISSRRETLIRRCITSVENQTYPNVEHIIVSDTPYSEPTAGLYYSLGRSWNKFTGGLSIGAIPRLAGTLLAHGEYIGYLDDDDEFLPNHVERLVSELERSKAAFVTSKFKRFWSDGRPPDIIGGPTIEHGKIGTPCVIHRVECLLKANWSLNGYREDFELFNNWVKAGLNFSHVPEVTVNVYKTV